MKQHSSEEVIVGDDVYVDHLIVINFISPSGRIRKVSVVIMNVSSSLGATAEGKTFYTVRLAVTVC